MNPPTGDYSKLHLEQEKQKEPAGEKDNEKPPKSRSSSTLRVRADPERTTDIYPPGNVDDDHKKQKVGFMAKMKGEAKILIGKVEGKKGHDKVEEGQRMKAGETI